MEAHRAKGIIPASGDTIIESDTLIAHCLVTCTLLALFCPPSLSLLSAQPGGALVTFHLALWRALHCAWLCPSSPPPGWSSRTRCFLRQGISSCFCKRKQSLRGISSAVFSCDTGREQTRQAQRRRSGRLAMCQPRGPVNPLLWAVAGCFRNETLKGKPDAFDPG